MSVILSEGQIKTALNAIAARVSSDVKDMNALVIVGVHTGGVHLARRLQRILTEISGVVAPCGTLDITLYRDDLFEGFSKPIVGETSLPCSIEGKEVLLVDDVLYTGRTVRAALFELMDYGRPKRIRLAVLIDRGRRELPIGADYVGLVVETSHLQNVHVHLAEEGAEDEVLCLERV